MKRILGCTAACVFSVGAILLATPILAAPPTVVVSLKCIDDLLDDADLFAAAAGQQGLKSTAEALINGVTRGSGFAGVDREKPLGAYWNLTTPAPNDIGKIVAFLPISDVKEFQKLVKTLAPDFKETNGQWTLTAGSMPLFAKMSGGYCFVSPSVEALASLPEPKQILDSKYDVAIDLNLGSVPKEVKAFFLQATEEGGRKSLAQGPKPKNDAEAIGQQIGFDGALAVLKSVTNDGDRLTFGVKIDSETRLASIDFALTSKPNSPLAKAMSVYANTTPAFAAVAAEEAPLRLVLSYPVPALGDRSKQMFDAIRKNAETEIDKDEKLDTEDEKKAARDVASRLLNIVQATLESGTMHSVIVVDEGDDETVQIVAGIKLAKGDDAAKLLDEIVKLSKASPDYADFKLDVAKHAGARIHSITPGGDNPLAEKFGDGPIHLAIRSDSIWIALGGGNLESLKSALDLSGKKASRTDPPISIRAKPATFIGLVEDDKQDLIARAESLAGETGDVFNAEIAPIEGNGVKLHIVFGVDLIKLGVPQ